VREQENKTPGVECSTFFLSLTDIVLTGARRQVHPYNAVFGKLLDAEKRSALPPRQEHVEPP
jgi:hypothetical protein